jgi:hypothetical protein
MQKKPAHIDLPLIDGSFTIAMVIGSDAASGKPAAATGPPIGAWSLRLSTSGSQQTEHD